MIIYTGLQKQYTLRASNTVVVYRVVPTKGRENQFVDFKKIKRYSVFFRDLLHIYINNWL